MNLPKHLAIIMDGNGRWAQKQHRPRTFGHIKGTRVAKKIITECSRLGMKYLTLYAFSSENWFRPQVEVNFLMRILQRYLARETQNLIKENIRIKIIGDLSQLPADVLLAINHSMKATEGCTGLELIFALSYGSRQEILRSFQLIAERVKSGELDPADITEEMINSNLYTEGVPEPDLILRTSGEKRLSNFLLWQAAYSEFYFCDTLWPDFTKMDLNKALLDYSNRKRRFGKVEDFNEPLHH